MVGLPNFQTWGTRSWHGWAEPDADKLHLSDKMRAKMGKVVVKFFQGVLERKGPLVTGIN